MTFGDAFVYTMLILASGVATWAAIIAAGLLFARKVRHATDVLEKRPGVALGLGAGVGIVGIAIGIALMNAPAAPIKILGFIDLLLLALVATVGAAGLAALAGTRIGSLAPDRSAFASFSRGAAVLVAAAYVPGLGWLLLMPLQLFAGIGAGILALRRRPEPAPQADSVAL